MNLEDHQAILKTWHLVKNLWPNATQISERVYNIEGMLVLDFWHPANRFPDVMNYYTVTVLLHQALFPFVPFVLFVVNAGDYSPSPLLALCHSRLGILQKARYEEISSISKDRGVVGGGPLLCGSVPGTHAWRRARKERTEGFCRIVRCYR